MTAAKAVMAEIAAIYDESSSELSLAALGSSLQDIEYGSPFVCPEESHQVKSPH